MAAAKGKQNEDQYLVWSRRIQSEENYVQLYCLHKDDCNHRFFVLKFNSLSQDSENSKELFTTYSQSARIAITKSDTIPLSMMRRAVASRYTELYYKVFKNCFTAGLIMVQSGAKHNIEVSKGILDIYICRQREKYINKCNSGKALVNNLLIQEDFLSPQEVTPGEPLQIYENYVYFFYTRDLASFRILSASMSTSYQWSNLPRSDVSFLFYMLSYSGPLDEEQMKSGNNEKEGYKQKSTAQLEAELENVKNENRRLRAIIQKVHQLTADNQ